MSAGDLTDAEMVGTTECHTPACWSGPHDPQRTLGRNGLAEVWRIGRLLLLICQHCARHSALNDNWREQAEERRAEENRIGPDTDY